MTDHASSDEQTRNLETWERLRDTFDTIAREGSATLMRENYMHLGLAIANELPAMDKDMVLDLSLVKTEKPLLCPRELTVLEIELEGLRGVLPLLQGPGQEATVSGDDPAGPVRFRLSRNPAGPAYAGLEAFLAAGHGVGEGLFPEAAQRGQVTVLLVGPLAGEAEGLAGRQVRGDLLFVDGRLDGWVKRNPG